jgi:hypothetical protein
MKHLFSAILLLASISLSTIAAEKDQTKPNTVTPQEIADGWFLLFDGETTFGWQADGEAKTENALLMLGGKHATKAWTTMDLLGFEIAFKAPKCRGEGSVHIMGGGTCSYGIANSDDGTLGHRFTYDPRRQKKEPAILFNVPAKTQIALQTVKCRPLQTRPLFNARGLSGWKEIKSGKTWSVFTVTRQGELRIQDGPGELRTQDEFDNYALQLECKTNGRTDGVLDFVSCPGAQLRIQPARKPVNHENEWNSLTVVAQDKHVAVWLNGYQAADFTRQSSGKGPIILRGKDATTDVRFRNIRMMPLP